MLAFQEGDPHRNSMEVDFEDTFSYYLGTTTESDETEYCHEILRGDKSFLAFNVRESI